MYICSEMYINEIHTPASVCWKPMYDSFHTQPGRPAFTVPQKQEATEVLFQRAKEIGVKSLKEVPPLSDYGVENLSKSL